MSTLREHIPNGTIAKLLVAWGVVIVFLIFGPTWLHEPIDPLIAVVCFVVIFVTILPPSAWCMKRTTSPINWASPTAR